MPIIEIAFENKRRGDGVDDLFPLLPADVCAVEDSYRLNSGDALVPEDGFDAAFALDSLGKLFTKPCPRSGASVHIYRVADDDKLAPLLPYFFEYFHEALFGTFLENRPERGGNRLACVAICKTGPRVAVIYR